MTDHVIAQHRARLRRLARRSAHLETARAAAARAAYADGLSIDAIRAALGLAARSSAHRLVHGRPPR